MSIGIELDNASVIRSTMPPFKVMTFVVLMVPRTPVAKVHFILIIRCCFLNMLRHDKPSFV